MANYTATDAELTAIANAIRSKGGTQAQLEYSSGFVTAINNISTGIDTSDATLNNANQMLSGVTAYSNGTKYTGTITSKSAQTYTPGTTDQTIAAGQYLSGTQTISGDADLVPGNIKDGVDIFGVTGTLKAASPQWDDDVLFIDYDGTYLYSYTAEEFANLNEMPPNPNHTDIGLVADGWNWTLAAAKTQVSSSGECIIGQMYRTVSGNTEINLDVYGDSYGGLSAVAVCIRGTTTSFSGKVYWGDGYSTSVTGGANTTVGHTYSASGNYTIQIEVLDGTFTLSSGNYYRACVGYSTSSINGNLNQALAATVSSIRCGDGCVGFYEYACQYMRNLKEVIMHSECSNVQGYCFDRCSALTTLIMPNTSTGPTNFPTSLELTSLRNISLSARVDNSVSIEGLKSVRRIVFPYYLSSLSGGSTSRYAQNAERITFPSRSTVTISQNNLCAYFYNLKEVKNYSSTQVPQGCFANCHNLTELPVFNNPITSIGSSAFEYCTSLKKVVVPNSVQSLSGSSFAYCTALKEFTFPANEYFTTIPQDVLRDCTSLEKVIIPANVTNISQYAFRNCSSLYEIHFLSSSPPTIANNNAFSTAYGSPIIYVPTGSLSAYQSASYYPSGADWREE